MKRDYWIIAVVIALSLAMSIGGWLVAVYLSVAALRWMGVL